MINLNDIWTSLASPKEAAVTIKARSSRIVGVGTIELVLPDDETVKLLLSDVILLEDDETADDKAIEEEGSDDAVTCVDVAIDDIAIGETTDEDSVIEDKTCEEVSEELKSTEEKSMVETGSEVDTGENEAVVEICIANVMTVEITAGGVEKLDVCDTTTEEL